MEDERSKKLERLSLEEIGDMLLSGEIDSKKAEKLIEETGGKPIFFNIPQKPRYIFDIGDNYMALLTREREVLSSLQFGYWDDGLGTYIRVEDARSFFPNKGYFGKLFRAFERRMRRQGASHIILDVDISNRRAQEIYDHFRFYSLGPIDTISENIDRISMRKDL